MSTNLPKGMKASPEEYTDGLDQEETQEYSMEQVTHSVVNYTGIIREALESIEEFDVSVDSLNAMETNGLPPSVTMELSVRLKE